MWHVNKLQTSQTPEAETRMEKWRRHLEGKRRYLKQADKMVFEDKRLSKMIRDCIDRKEKRS